MSHSEHTGTARLAMLERQLADGEWDAAMTTVEGLGSLLQSEFESVEARAMLEGLRARCLYLADKVESSRDALQARLDHHRRGQRAAHAYTAGALAGTD